MTNMAQNALPSITSSTSPSATRSPTFIAFPTEILEKIASFLAMDDMLNLRLTNHYIAQNTTDAFATAFVHELTLPSCCCGSENTLAGVISRPDWASKVRKMNVQLPYEGSFHLAGALSLFPNLHTIHFDIFADYPDDFELFFAQLRLPALKNLIVMESSARYFDASNLKSTIQNHRGTLKKVELLGMAVYETDDENRPKWVDILKTVKLLKSDAKLRIYDPVVATGEDRRFVSFTPPKAEVDNGPVELDMDPQDGRFHLLTYTTRHGGFSAAIDTMIKNFELVTTKEAAKRSGILGKVYADDDSDSDDEGAEEDEDEEDNEDEEAPEAVWQAFLDDPGLQESGAFCDVDEDGREDSFIN